MVDHENSILLFHQISILCQTVMWRNGLGVVGNKMDLVRLSVILSRPLKNPAFAPECWLFKKLFFYFVISTPFYRPKILFIIHSPFLSLLINVSEQNIL